MKQEEGFIPVEDNVRLYYRKIGDRADVIVIPNGLYFFDDFHRFTNSHSLIFYDLRNRGLSDSVADPSKLERGIQNDVEDLEKVRAYFNLDQFTLIGHSYVGLLVGLYAIKHAAAVSRLIQIGPAEPDPDKKYPAEFTNTDSVSQQVFLKIGQMQKENPPNNPEQRCRRFWKELRAIYVANPENAEKINWGRCELDNERNFMKYWMASIFPSIKKIHLTAADMRHVTAPVLVIHGTLDRSAPYGSGRDWASFWPKGRLLTVANAAHAPWIEAPEIVFQAIEAFLNGGWPKNSEKLGQ